MHLGKKIWTIAAVLALLFSGNAGGIAPHAAHALAEEIAMPELLVEAAASPGELVEPGEIRLHFTLTNRSSETLHNVSLTSADGLTKDPLEDMAPGTTLEYSRAHNVTHGELTGGAIHYVVTCTTGSGLFSYPVDAPIVQTVAEPNVEFQRRLSSEFVSDGNAVVAVYSLKNTGNIDVHDVTLSDPLGGFSVQLDTLAMGESETFLNRAFPADGDRSAPVLEYTTGADQENIYVSRLDEIVISAAINMLDVSFSAGESMLGGDSVEVILELSNGGNAAYRNITVYDDIYGGVIADSVTLPTGGESVICSHTYPLRGTETYRWRITGVNEAGESIDLLTDTLEYAAAAPASPAKLSLNVKPGMTRISRAGYVPFTLTLENAGGEPAANVQIIEETLGDVYELAIVPTDEPIAFDVRYPVREDTVFAFSARYTDGSGVQHTLSAEPIQVVLAAGGERPEPFEQSDSLFSGVSVQMGESPIFAVMLVGSCIVLAVLSVVLLVTSRRARKLRRERAAAHRQRLKEEMAKTNRFKPVKRPAHRK